MPRQGLGHSSVDIYNMVTPGTDDPVWRNKTSGQLMVGYQQTRSNFVLFSQDATDAEAWTKQNTAISTTLYEAPDNSTTANAIKSNTTGSKNYYLQQQSLSVTAGKTYTASVHLKKGALGFGWLRAGDGTTDYSAAFNLNTGAVTNTSQVLSTSVDAMDDDWFRCSVTFQAQNTSSNGNVIVFAQIDATDNTPNVAVSGVELLYVWGWQLEENSEMSAYIVTTNAARTTTETLNDTSETWDFDSADLMPEADPDDDGVWEILANVVLNGDYEELGSELVTNGDFATDSNWTKGTGWSIGGGVAISDGSSGYSFLQQTSVNILNGKTYKISYSVTSYTSGSVEVGVGGTSNNNIQRNSVGDFVEYHTSNGTNLTIISRNLIGSIDNISVKQVDPNDRWSLGTGWTISDGKANFNTTGNSTIDQDLSITPGTTYRIQITGEITSGGLKLSNGSGLGNDGSIGLPLDTLYTHDGGSNDIQIRTLGASVGYLDTVSVTEYAIQPQDV